MTSQWKVHGDGWSRYRLERTRANGSIERGTLGGQCATEGCENQARWIPTAPTAWVFLMYHCEEHCKEISDNPDNWRH